MYFVVSFCTADMASTFCGFFARKNMSLDEDLEKMDSDLKYVLGVMRRSHSRKMYEEFIFKNIRSHLTFIENPITGEEEADMCKALNDIEKHALKKGERRGKRQGEINTLCSLVVDGILKMEDAAKRARLSETDFDRKLVKYKEQHFLISERKC